LTWTAKPSTCETPLFRNLVGESNVYAIAMETSSHQRSVILAVDDDDDDIDLMRLLFRKAGVTHPVEVYRQGEDLIDALTALVAKPRDNIPLLCFLDVKMPTISGHELLRWMRQKPELDHLSVVMLSSSEHPEDVKQAAEGGAQCYLAKYPHPSVLKGVLEEAERLASRGAAVSKEWFALQANLLLRRGLSNGQPRPASA
jgi:CheY-like chemotaxis protein